MEIVKTYTSFLELQSSFLQNNLFLIIKTLFLASVTPFLHTIFNNVVLYYRNRVFLVLFFF